MRCIEIAVFPPYMYLPYWLTLTWDVLKYSIFGENVTVEYRLTLTWDVLKCNTVTRKP